MSILDDGSNMSLLVAGLVLFTIGAVLAGLRGMYTCDRALAELPDTADEVYP